MGFCGSTRKGRYSRIGRVARTIQARRAAGGEVQARYPTALLRTCAGSWRRVERVVRAAEQATSRECAANTLRTDAIKLPGALRWVGRRVRGVQLFLSLIISLYPVKFGGLEPTVSAFGDALGSGPLLAPAARQRSGAAALAADPGRLPCPAQSRPSRRNFSSNTRRG